MKIDTTAIEGYADMTPEQKLAALEALELPEPDYSGYVKKDMFDKKVSELNAAKKDVLAKMSEDERAKQEREEELAQLRERNKELERTVSIASYKATYLGMGYDDALAEDTANAWADGNFEKIIQNQQKYNDAYAKKVKAGMLGTMETPPAGSGEKAVTAEEIMAITDDAKRQQMIAEHLDLFQ